MTKGSVERVKAREKGDTWGEGRKEKTEGDRQTPRDRDPYPPAERQRDKLRRQREKQLEAQRMNDRGKCGTEGKGMEEERPKVERRETIGK